MTEGKRIFKKYEFYNNQFDAFTRALGALRILGLKFSFYNQPPPKQEDEMIYPATFAGSDYRNPLPVVDHNRYYGDWHIIEVYQEND